MQGTVSRGKAIHITGIVQGVGFRPYVYNLALRHHLSGWVRNTSQGVDIRVEGCQAHLDAFLTALTHEAPPLSHIDSLTATDCPSEAFEGFEIRYSERIEGAFQPISPDIALCDDCMRELLDPHDRRYRYPFINCTNCGPRFTIIEDIPYDRPLTTMSAFAMCPDCDAEYHDPTNRRFHAQPVACPECGPLVWLEVAGQRVDSDAAIRQTVAMLRQGAILAIKGLGGFHLACDATNEQAVAELRRRKHRVDKPFALMMANLDQIEAYCRVSPAEANLLYSPASPIVLLNQRPQTDIAPSVAPGQASLGVMRPYTPLHVLLFEEGMPPLVMTSGNHAEEPIVTANDDARTHLATLADAFLMHNRDIHIRTDDSVVRVCNNKELPIRRSRGYAPFPVKLPFELPPVLAVGGELKNTFCLTRDGYAFMSHHIGNMENLSTLTAFEQGVQHFERLFRASPSLIVCDQHPDYLATRYAHQQAEERSLPLVTVQHHHAHIAACMAENGHAGDRPVLGVCFDGTGLGTDGTIWGGEFLLADYAHFDRVAYLKPMPLPGGDAATRKPARIAYAYLLANDLLPADDLPFAEHLSSAEMNVIQQQIAKGINTPLTSSMGRLFDAVSALLGICHTATYEGQAAIQLEALVDAEEDGFYPLPYDGTVIDMQPLLAQVLADIRANLPIATMAARFHNSVAYMIARVCQHIAANKGITEVALSGGVFQNVTLLSKTVPLLEEAGLTVLLHHQVPPNDGGIALGQAVIGYVQAQNEPIDEVERQGSVL